MAFFSLYGYKLPASLPSRSIILVNKQVVGRVSMVSISGGEDVAGVSCRRQRIKHLDSEASGIGL